MSSEPANFVLIHAREAGAHVSTFATREEVITELLLSAGDEDLISSVRQLLDGGRPHYFVKKERRPGRPVKSTRFCALCGFGRSNEVHFKEW